AERTGLALAETLRDRYPQLRLASHCGGGSFKSQLKAADRSGAQAALILGEAEVAAGTVALKPLRSDDQQQSLAAAELAERVGSFLT
ncbi:MAG: histidine--tRNA ligase, partial [Gammaproteobacteria bacterium]|nr:histidine--tRNA ligase [Gammaproteobacteria bacterium]